MLIGKVGRFVLLPPFTFYSTTGLTGEIVGVNYIQHLVSKGTNVKSLVYSPVNGDSLYTSDLASNVIIVTIKDASGKKYNIPDRYIENLYDDSLNYIEAYVTVKIGSLPRNYDYSYIKNQLATEVTKLSGVPVTSDDVYVSAQGSGSILSKDEVSLLDTARKANIANLNTDYGKYLDAANENKVLKSKLDSLEKGMFDLIG